MQTEFEKKLDEAREIIETLSSAYDDELKEKNDRIEELEKDNANMEEKIDELESDNSDLQNKVDEYERETSH